MIDSHCHLAGTEFEADLPAVVARARDAGLTGALVILAADDANELARAATVTAAWPAVRFATGIHPHAAAAHAQDLARVVALVASAIDSLPGVRAVGEVGLDYHYDFAPREAQLDVFRAQIGLARARQLPLVIHTREADDDTFDTLQAERAPDIGGVFHCFTGTCDVARRALDLGFHISLSGIATFPRAGEVREVARLVPLDRLLIETDSPYLAPVPFRGSRNEPARVARVADVVAEVRGMAVSALVDAVRANYTALFKP